MTILHLLRNVKLYSTKSGGHALLPPSFTELSSKDNVTQARRWVERFASGAESTTALREAAELTFSRSSGPGGQNVNKVNTKCTARLPLSADLVPLWAKDALRRTPAYVRSSNSLLTTSSVFRSQAQNINDCLSKMKKVIVEASLADVVNEPSAEQKARVVSLQKSEKLRTRKEKDYRSALKKSRSQKKGDWD